MNAEIIWTIIGTGLAIAGINVWMFTWLRSEANADRRDIHNILLDMTKDTKDFHARMCVLEERYIKLFKDKFSIG